MRRLRFLALAVAALAQLLVTASAYARGSSVHYVYVPVYTYRAGPPQPYAPGATLEMPVEITDAAPAHMEGVAAPHDVIAQHAIRAMQAVVIDSTVEGHRAVPAGTALPRVIMRNGAHETILWCDMRANPAGLGGDAKFDCLQDHSGTGKLDALWSLTTSDQLFGFGGDEVARFTRILESPVGFRQAKPEERPLGLIGYEWCGGDGVASPARFEVSASFFGGSWEDSPTHACQFGAVADPADKSIAVVDAIKIAIIPGKSAKRLSFKVLDRIPPEPIAHLRPDGPIRALADAQASDAMPNPARALLYDTSQARTASGIISKGAPFFVIGVRHGITGVLTSDVWQGHRDFFGRSRPPDAPGLNAGQIVFARSVGDADGVKLVWCAPRRSAAGEWTDSVCMPSDGKGNLWIVVTPSLMPSTLMMPGVAPPYVTPPNVKLQPVDLPAMKVSLAFEGWTKDAAKIDSFVDWGAGPKMYKTTTVARVGDGPALVPVPFGQMSLTPGAAPNTATVSFIMSPLLAKTVRSAAGSPPVAAVSSAPPPSVATKPGVPTSPPIVVDVPAVPPPSHTP